MDIGPNLPDTVPEANPEIAHQAAFLVKTTEVTLYAKT